VKVKVLYFASLREQLGMASEEVEVPAGITTVAGLRGHLRSRGGKYEAIDKGPVRAAVNQDMSQGTAAIRAGDEVAFFPPVTGG
jgi:molybdopterin synthase sulfur carrier subunit